MLIVFLTKKRGYVPATTFRGSFEMFSLQQYSIWSDKAINWLFKPSLEGKIKTRRERRLACKTYFFQFRTTSCLCFHENPSVLFCVFDIFMAWNPDKRTLEKLYSHVARVIIKNRNLNIRLRVTIRFPSSNLFHKNCCR